MKTNILTISLFIVFAFGCAQTKTSEPKNYGAIPSESQLAWHEMEYFSLVCYGLNTYTEEEWAYGDVDPGLFTPSNLDTDQWAKVAKDAGMKGLILVAKHHDGFCLWPSKYTDYSVEATPWKDGKGDILGDLSKSCKKFGLKLGVYLSPWDRNHAEYGKPEYIDYFYKQLEELMTEYGDVFEFWIDGANGGTGYYGGAKDRRNIDRKTYYGYDTIFSIVKKYQPNALIFSDVGPGSRWVGNESGIGGETNWNTITTDGKFPGETDGDYSKKLGSGEFGGTEWIPAEINTTLSWPKAWYYHTGKKPRSLKNLVDLYYTSIGRGGALDLGLAIAPSGQIREEDKTALLKFKKHMDREFAVNLAEKVNISTSNNRSGKIFSPKSLIDNNTNSYWATEDNVQEATIVIDFGKETTFNRLVLQEFIKLGQRVHSFKVTIEKDGKDHEIISGTTIGYKRALRFEEATTKKLKITLSTQAPCLTLSNIEVYNAPMLVDDPIASYDRKGTLSFEVSDNVKIYYTISDDKNKSDFKLYTKPVQLPYGGKVFSYAKDTESDYETDIIVEEYGLPRNGWKVSSVDGKSDEIQASIIDNSNKSFYLSDKNSKTHNVIIDMGKVQEFNGFSYLPRQDGEKEGIIMEYEFYVSVDMKQWGSPVAQGAFHNIENNPVRQMIKLNNTEKGRYIKFVSKSTVRQDGMASFAEIEIYN